MDGQPAVYFHALRREFLGHGGGFRGLRQFFCHPLGKRGWHVRWAEHAPPRVGGEAGRALACDGLHSGQLGIGRGRCHGNARRRPDVTCGPTRNTDPIASGT